LKKYIVKELEVRFDLPEGTIPLKEVDPSSCINGSLKDRHYQVVAKERNKDVREDG